MATRLEDIEAVLRDFIALSIPDDVGFELLQARAKYELERNDRKGGKGMPAIRAKGIETRQKLFAERVRFVYPLIQKARGEGVSTYRAIATWLDEHGIMPANADKWSAGVVQRIEDAGQGRVKPPSIPRQKRRPTK